jgi:hypothetical protein
VVAHIEMENLTDVTLVVGAMAAWSSPALWPAFIPRASGDLLCEVKSAKNVLLNLAGCGLRKMVDEPPDPRDLVGGQAFSTELRQFLLGDLMPRLDLDKSDGHFAPFAIRNPDDRRSMTAGWV